MRSASIYLYRGIEWAIVEVPGHSWYFEADKLVDSKAAGKKALEEIETIAGELGLEIFNKQELLDTEANKVFKLT